MFKPDKRKPTYRMLTNVHKKPPKVVFGSTALKWIRALMGEHDTEVGFYAIVDERGEGEAMEHFIREVFYPMHDLATSGTCEISPEGETAIMNWLIEKNRVDDIAKIRFWGHKHPHGSTSPSGQDEAQAIERMNSTNSYLIRAICSGDEISVSFFDYNSQLRFDNLNWEVEEDDVASIMVTKLDRIQEILALGYTEETAKRRMIDVMTIMSIDEEMENIIAKVRELKEVNIPKEKPPYYGREGYSANNKKGYSVSDKRGFTVTNKRKTGGVKQLSFLNPNDTKQTDVRTDDNEILNAEEVASLLDDIDQEIYQFGQFGQFAHGDMWEE